MPNSISPSQIASSLHVENDHAYVTSNELARVFDKSHHNILRDIEMLECSDEFRQLNFESSKYVVKSGRNTTRTYKCYHITRDGFSFLAMGFTGARAAQFKEAYIQAFNQMERQLRQPVQTERGPTKLPFNTIKLPDTRYQRILLVVEHGHITETRLLSHDESFFDRRCFINFFKEPCVRFDQVDQLTELSKAVNDRLVSLVHRQRGK